MNENDRRIYGERTRAQHFSIRATITIALAIVTAAIFMNYAPVASAPSGSTPTSYGAATHLLSAVSPSVAADATLSSHQSSTSIAATLSAWAGKNGAVANAQLNAAALTAAKYIAQHPFTKTEPRIRVPFGRTSSCWVSGVAFTGAVVTSLSSTCPVPWAHGAYFGVAEVSGSSGIAAVSYFAEDPSTPALRAR
jgi:hypothetical protein